MLLAMRMYPRFPNYLVQSQPLHSLISSEGAYNRPMAMSPLIRAIILMSTSRSNLICTFLPLTSFSKCSRPKSVFLSLSSPSLGAAAVAPGTALVIALPNPLHRRDGRLRHYRLGCRPCYPNLSRVTHLSRLHLLFCLVCHFLLVGGRFWGMRRCVWFVSLLTSTSELLMLGSSRRRQFFLRAEEQNSWMYSDSTSGLRSIDTGFKALWRTAGAMFVFYQPSAHAAAAPSMTTSLTTLMCVFCLVAVWYDTSFEALVWI
jgi:hypothetical protein